MAEVVTGEAVVLEVPCARFPSRMLALAIDLAIQLTIIAVLLTIVALGAADHSMNTAEVTAIVVTVIVLALIGYPVVWEAATRGRSPGKLALGLRVVGDDGSPERFRQALVRGLATTGRLLAGALHRRPRPYLLPAVGRRASGSATSSRARSSSSTGCPPGGAAAPPIRDRRRSSPPGRPAWSCPG